MSKAKRTLGSFLLIKQCPVPSSSCDHTHVWNYRELATLPILNESLAQGRFGPLTIGSMRKNHTTEQSLSILYNVKILQPFCQWTWPRGINCNRTPKPQNVNCNAVSGVLVYWLSMQTHNTGVVSSNFVNVTIKTLSARKATGNHLIKSTSLVKN